MKIGWRGALGILLSAAFLVFAFKGIEWAKVADNVRRANVGLLLLSAIAATCIFPLRARRWRPILDPIAPHLPFRVLWPPTAIGMMVTNVFPVRAGELARAFALSRTTPAVPFPAAFASIAVDRLFDAIVVFSLMFLAMLDPSFPPGAHVLGYSMSSLAMAGVVFAGGVLASMYLMVLFPARVLSLFEAVARRIAPRLEERGRAAIVALIGGLSVLRAPGRFAAVLGWTLAHWLLNALAFWIAFRAVGITASFSAALFLQGLIAIFVALPQAPGFFGVFELLGKEGLGLYGVSPDAAVTWAIGFHFLSYVPITLIGGWYFVRAGLSLGEIGCVERDDEAGTRTVAPGE
jgi:uncharacterized protein (TIRG00374 family)